MLHSQHWKDAKMELDHWNSLYLETNNFAAILVIMEDPRKSQSRSTPASPLLHSPPLLYITKQAVVDKWHRWKRHSLYLSVSGGFSVFSCSLFLILLLSRFCAVGRGQGGKEVSLNRLMRSIQRTLYTSSIKRESALYAAGIVPLKAAKKASYMLPWRKK